MSKIMSESVSGTEKKWFAVEQISADTVCISEPRHWEQTACYLLLGEKKALLIDTGLGIFDISKVVRSLTTKPVTALATHIHWDHIGGHRYFSEFYAHKAELPWLCGAFPLPVATVRSMMRDHCQLPPGHQVETYELFQGTPTGLLDDGDRIDLGGRQIQVLHTPGHAPGHMCLWEADRGWLFTGDLVYGGMLYANYPSTDPNAYLESLEKIAELPVQRVFPAHYGPVSPSLIVEMRDAFRSLKVRGLLRHGSGIQRFTNWSVSL